MPCGYNTEQSFHAQISSNSDITTLLLTPVMICGHRCSVSSAWIYCNVETDQLLFVTGLLWTFSRLPYKKAIKTRKHKVCCGSHRRIRLVGVLVEFKTFANEGAYSSLLIRVRGVHVFLPSTVCQRCFLSSRLGWVYSKLQFFSISQKKDCLIDAAHRWRCLGKGFNYLPVEIQISLDYAPIGISVYWSHIAHINAKFNENMCVSFRFEATPTEVSVFETALFWGSEGRRSHNQWWNCA